HPHRLKAPSLPSPPAAPPSASHPPADDPHRSSPSPYETRRSSSAQTATRFATHLPESTRSSSDPSAAPHPPRCSRSHRSPQISQNSAPAHSTAPAHSPRRLPHPISKTLCQDSSPPPFPQTAD